LWNRKDAMTADLDLIPDRTALLVIDVQEKLAAAMPAELRVRCIANVERLVRAAAILRLPVLVTEQYPQGLGPTVEPVRDALQGLPQAAVIVEKRAFDVCRAASCAAALRSVAGDPQLGSARGLVVAGMEAHICVYQTVRGLVRRGYAVHVASDATCSRNPDHHRIAEGLWTRCGATVSCAETVLFDLLGEGQGEAFKAVSKLVR
jgi:nicotinamidase-related amidase